MDYDGLKVPTAVFTPFEYGCVGESEDTAETVYGKNNVDCFLWSWKSLELEASNRMKHESIDEGSYEPISPNCFAKLICLKSEGNRIVGFHFVGPNAGEVLQGFSLALNLGATKSDFDKMSKSPFGSIHFHSINRLTNIFTFFLTHSLLLTSCHAVVFLNSSAARWRNQLRLHLLSEEPHRRRRCSRRKPSDPLLL